MTAGQEFMKALDEFYAAGMRLVDAWDDGEGFNADKLYPLPDRLKPPLSMDEWLLEFSNHYRGWTPADAAFARSQACSFEHDDLNERGELCQSCETGICGDCGRVIYYVEAEGWYRHATNVAVGCFLIGPEDEEGNALPRPTHVQYRDSVPVHDAPTLGHGSVPVQYAEPDQQGGRVGTLVEFSEAFGDQREIGESEGPFSDYNEAYKQLGTLGLPVFDGSGCLYIGLGKEVYGLVDFDGGEYRIGLYFEGEAEEGGGVCALFHDFESTKSFIERLRKVHAPQGVTA